MATEKFQSKTGGVPFPRSAKEWEETGKTPALADHLVCKDVFGHNYRIDAKGYPIETGRGSPANPCDESQRAIESEKSAAEQARMRLGWHKGLEGAFDPKSAAAAR